MVYNIVFFIILELLELLAIYLDLFNYIVYYFTVYYIYENFLPEINVSYLISFNNIDLVFTIFNIKNIGLGWYCVDPSQFFLVRKNVIIIYDIVFPL